MRKDNDIRAWFRPRAADAHKGDNGHVLIVAGSNDMPGAAALCALGALRAGAGLVTVAASKSVQTVVHAKLLEAMTVGRDHLDRFIEKRRINVLAIGPGLGVSATIKKLVLHLLKKILLVFRWYCQLRTFP